MSETKKQENKPKEEKKEQDEQKEIEVPEKFKKLVDEIEKMKVIDLAELVKILEKKFGVSATPQVVAGPAAGAGAAGEAAGAAEEKSAYNIELTGVGDKKIDVIKVIRDVTEKGLKESKDLVDAVAAGTAQMIKENAKKDEAAAIKKKFETAGATVELK